MSDSVLSIAQTSICGGSGISDRDTPVQACGRDTRGSKSKKRARRRSKSERSQHFELDTPSAETPTHPERSVCSSRQVIISTSVAGLELQRLSNPLRNLTMRVTARPLEDWGAGSWMPD
jgi:hypothetical protein